jgi:signal peptidase
MKKALYIIGSIFAWGLAVVAIGMMIFTIVSVNTFNRAERELFGYKFFIVMSDSMSKTDFDAGDIVVVKEVDPSTLKEGDIISYTSQNSHNFGEVVTHKIRRLTTDAEGNPGFITYGTTTDTDDETVVTYPYVIGKYVRRIPKLGTFFHFLKTTPGYIICILIPFLLLILIQGINSIRLFRRYKQEQLEEIKAERERIEAERLESQKLMQELMALKEQLVGKETEDEASAAASDSD